MIDRRPAKALHEIERLRQDVLAIVRIANHVEYNVSLIPQQSKIYRRIRDYTVEMTIIAGSAGQIIDRRRAGHRRVQKNRRKAGFRLIGWPGDEWLQFLGMPEHSQRGFGLLLAHQDVAKLDIGIVVACFKRDRAFQTALRLLVVLGQTTEQLAKGAVRDARVRMDLDRQPMA